MVRYCFVIQRDGGPWWGARVAATHKPSSSARSDVCGPVRLIPGHRQPSDARDAKQRVDMLRNNDVDRIGKLAMTLPQPLFTPTSPSSISVGGTKSPTQVKKWLVALRTPPNPESIGSLGTYYVHGDAKRCCRGCGETSNGMNALPPGKRQRCTANCLRTRIEAHHVAA